MKDGNLFVIFPANAICECPSTPVTPGLIRGPGKEDEDRSC